MSKKREIVTKRFIFATYEIAEERCATNKVAIRLKI